MRLLVLFTALALFGGVTAVTWAPNPAIVLLGQLAIVASLIAGIVLVATTYFMSRSFAVHILRSDEFRWN